MTPTTKTDTDAPTLDATSVEKPTENAALPATLDGNHPAPVRFDDNEWDGVGDGDLAPPSETLLPLLPMNRKLGEGIVDPSTGEKADELRFVWLARMVTRAWWDRKFDDRDEKDPAPKCRSVDGVVGIGQFGPGSEHNPSGKCANCPVNTFGVPLIGDKEVPACRGSIEAMVALPDTTSGVALFRLRFGGIAFAAARAYWDSFRARLPKIPPIGFLTRMVLEPTDTKNGKFLGTVFSRVEQLNRADVQPLIDERDRLIEDFKRIVAEEVETRQADVDERDNRQHDEGDPFPDEPNDAPSTGLKRDTATSAAPSTPAPATPDPNEPF